MRRKIAWKVLRLLYRDRPFLFAQRVTFYGGVEVIGPGGDTYISPCLFEGD